MELCDIQGNFGYIYITHIDNTMMTALQNLWAFMSLDNYNNTTASSKTTQIRKLDTRLTI